VIQAFILLLFLIVVLFYAFCQVRNAKEISDEERTDQLILRARRMFPNERFDHDRLDKMYQPYRREWKEAMDLGDTQRANSYLRDLVLIHNAKLRALDHVIQFESEVIIPLNRKEVTLCPGK
jgi:hypothetical protein